MKQDNLANIQGLVGKKVRLKSGNIGGYELIGKGGLRCRYLRDASDEDMAEMNLYAANYVSNLHNGRPVQLTTVDVRSESAKEGMQIEQDVYQKFLKEDSKKSET